MNDVIINIGFELECYHPSPPLGYTAFNYIAEVLSEKLQVKTLTTINKISERFWAVGYDVSVAPRNKSIEIRSPINPDMEEVKWLLNKLKISGCQINSKCGLHFHVSSNKEITGVKFTPILVNGWRKRSKYYLSQESQDNNYGRYRRLRRISKHHIELRSTNATFNFRCITKIYKEIIMNLKYNRNIFVPTGAGQPET